MRYYGLAVFFGRAALVLTLWGTFAQHRRALRLGIEGISLATWTLFALMDCFWISYGVGRHSVFIALSSLLILPLQIAIVVGLTLAPDQVAINSCAGRFYLFVTGVTSLSQTRLLLAIESVVVEQFSDSARD